MAKYSDILVKFYRFMLLFFGVFDLALLWSMSVFFICFMSSDPNEMTFFCKDNAVLNLVFLVMFVVLLFFLKKKFVISKFEEKITDDIFYEKIKTILLRIIIVMGLAWVIITQYVPGSDQLDVMSSAYKYGVHDTNFLEAGGYLDKWLHNVGITTIERLLAFVVGDFNAMFMQLLNVFGIALIYKSLVDIWSKVGGSRLSQICTLASGVIFYPMIMYASFVYGNIWSVTFALWAFEAELDYFDKRESKYIFISALTIGLSYMVKGSGIIFLVALIIFAIVRGAMDKVKFYKIVIVVVALCLSFVLFSAVPKFIMSKIMGCKLRDSDGIWSFIAMGLQEDETTAGWYNGYCLRVYYDNNRDTVLSEKIAKKEVEDRLTFLFSDKHNAYQFFSKKTASMWIEPTYQGYWINQVREHRVIFPEWLNIFMSAKGYTVAARIFDYFQILIWTGTILWLIFEDKSKFANKSFFLLSFVGGFTFNLMWEAKSQYAITYYILLFPYAWAGFEMLVGNGVKTFCGKGAKAIDVVNTVNKPVLIYCVATIILYMAGYKMDASNCLSQHNATYDYYLSQSQIIYMDESINEINITKGTLKDLQTEMEYLRKKLDDNGVKY